MRSRFIKSPIAILGMLMLLASLPAAAQQGGKHSGPGGGQGRHMQPQQVPAHDAGPQHRDTHREGRMTPEQRRQLRRDVHNHGRDIYRDRPGPKQR